jgi:hypothetical protein
MLPIDAIRIISQFCPIGLHLSNKEISQLILNELIGKYEHIAQAKELLDAAHIQVSWSSLNWYFGRKEQYSEREMRCVSKQCMSLLKTNKYCRHLVARKITAGKTTYAGYCTLHLNKSNRYMYKTTTARYELYQQHQIISKASFKIK